MCNNHSPGQLVLPCSPQVCPTSCTEEYACHYLALSLTVLLHTGLSALRCSPSLSILMPFHLFSAHSWKPPFCSFPALFHFFLFLLLFNSEKYFLLQEKCPYALSELEPCCSLFAVSCVVVFNVHPEISISFCICGGRNPFEVIYETSCGWGPSHLPCLSLCSLPAIK